MKSKPQRKRAPRQRDAGGGGGGGHDGTGSMRWLLTYSDLITLMMVFFVMMYSIARVDASKYDALSQALRLRMGTAVAVPLPPVLPGPAASEPQLQYAEPAGPAVPPPPSPSQPPPPPPPPSPKPVTEPPKAEPDPLAKLAGALSDALGPGGPLEIRVGSEGIVVSILGSILFEPGKATLRPAAEPLLQNLSAELGKVPNQVIVQGSTDNTPVHTPEFPSNWELAGARASSVVRFFTGHGLSGQRFVAVSLAGEKPAFDNSTPDGRAANERVDVVVLRKPLSLATSKP